MQSGTILHLVNLGLGASQERLPDAQLQRIGKVSLLFSLAHLRSSPGIRLPRVPRFKPSMYSHVVGRDCCTNILRMHIAFVKMLSLVSLPAAFVGPVKQAGFSHFGCSFAALGHRVHRPHCSNLQSSAALYTFRSVQSKECE